MAKAKDIWAELSQPFEDDEIEWRVQRCGLKTNKVWAILVPYVNARAIMSRLDSVLGVACWSDSYYVVQTPTPGIACRLTIHQGDKPSITKEDAAECTEVSPVKGGYSDALKRAAVKFGMGRFLYALDVVFAENIQETRIKGGIHIYQKGKIDVWCPRPRLNGDPPKASEKEEPTVKGDLVSEVRRLVNERMTTGKFTMKHREKSLEKHLNIKDMGRLNDCSEKALAKYIEHLKEAA